LASYLSDITLVFTAVLMIAVSGLVAGQDEDFHRAKFPDKPEAVYKAADRAIMRRHPKDHWITLRDGMTTRRFL
jgi:hypothetical protein